MSKEIKIGIYKHYKGNKYKVVGTAKNTETEENLVIYQSIDGEEKMWARPEKMFKGFVKIKNKEVPRFEFIEEVDDDFEHKPSDAKVLEGKYKRALADYQNLLKTTAQEKQDFAKYANEQLILEIIPVYDHLKMALEHSDEKNHDQWLEGVKHVLNQFKNILESIGVEEIKTEGEKFDPEKMEAMEGQGEKVEKEVKPGYIYNGKVIVPARVILK